MTQPARSLGVLVVSLVILSHQIQGILPLKDLKLKRRCAPA